MNPSGTYLHSKAVPYFYVYISADHIGPVAQVPRAFFYVKSFIVTRGYPLKGLSHEILREKSLCSSQFILQNYFTNKIT